MYICYHTDQNSLVFIPFYWRNSVTEAVHCKSKCDIDLKPDCTILDEGDLTFQSPKPWTLVYIPENRPFSLKYSTS